MSSIPPGAGKKTAKWIAIGSFVIAAMNAQLIVQWFAPPKPVPVSELPATRGDIERVGEKLETLTRELAVTRAEFAGDRTNTRERLEKLERLTDRLARVR